MNFRGDELWQTLDSYSITNAGGEQTYTMEPGDSLSKVSKHFYGSVNHYSEIAKANGISDPDKVQAGKTITIPSIG
ncbi:MAG: LysM peptidoglycan-binding domain-containing protein [Acidobacteriaceae bacterium]